MKKLFYFLLIPILQLSFVSCNNEETTKQELTYNSNSKDTLIDQVTGTEIINTKLKCASFQLFGDNKKLASNVIERGKSLVIRINDVEGLQKNKENKSNIGCAIKIFDEQGTLLFADVNLFRYVKPFNNDSVNDFQSAVLIPSGTKAMNILVSGAFYDVADTSSKILFQSKLTLSNPDNPKGIFKTFYGDGIIVEKSILQTALNGVVKENKMAWGDTLYLFAIEPKGFIIEGGKLSLDCETSVYDENKKTILSNPSLFANVGLMDAINTKMLNAAIIITEPLKKNKKYNWRVRFYDKRNPNKEVIYLFPFIIE